MRARSSGNRRLEKYQVGKEESHGRFSYLAETNHMVNGRFYVGLRNRGFCLLQHSPLIASSDVTRNRETMRDAVLIPGAVHHRNHKATF